MSAGSEMLGHFALKVHAIVAKDGGGSSEMCVNRTISNLLLIDTITLP